jgi:hypothetical protein
MVDEDESTHGQSRLPGAGTSAYIPRTSSQGDDNCSSKPLHPEGMVATA